MAEILKEYSYMALPSSIKRGNPAPLDVSEIWYSEEEMLNYVQNDPTAYVGQRLTLVNEETGTAKSYVISGTENGGVEEIAPATQITNVTQEVTNLTQVVEQKIDADKVYTKEEIDDISNNIDEALSAKAEAANVYTKEEADLVIDQKVAAAAHLKRKIFDSLELAQAYVDVNDDADQYIYMVPSGLTADANKYYEYLVVDDKLEQVGNWEVNLDDYVTEDEAALLLADYHTKDEIATLLSDYALKSDLEGYYTIDDINEMLESYYSKDEIDGLLAGYVQAEEGKSLVSNSEIAKLATVKENAEANFIKSVDAGKFSVSAEGNLTLNELGIDDITDLRTELNNRVEKEYFSVAAVDEEGNPIYDEETGEQIFNTVEGALLSPEDKEKLDALDITDEGIQISGTVTAANVKGLEAWITSRRDSVDGLYSTSEAAKVTKAIADLEALTASVGTNATDIAKNAADIVTLNSSVNSLTEQLNNYVQYVDYKAKMDSIDSEIGLLKDAMTWKAMEE
jgi:hypothetical protein